MIQLPPDFSLAAWTVVVGIAASVPCAILGCYLVLRRMSLLGDAISHAVLPGIALGFLFSGQLVGPWIVVGAMALGLLTAFLSQTIQRAGGVSEDSSLGVVFTSLFALGVLLITNAAADVDLDPGCVLYGLIEFAPLDSVPIAGLEVPRSLGPLGFAFALTVGFVALFWKELLISSFDPPLARSSGLRPGLVHYLLMAMVAGVTVAAFEAVGSILVVAMLIVPPATALLLSDRLAVVLVWSVVVAILSSVLGYSGAHAWDTSVAGMMAVSAGGLFAAALVLAPRHGLLQRLGHRLSLALRIAGEDILATLYRDEELAGLTQESWHDLQTCRRVARSTCGRALAAMALARLEWRSLVERGPRGIRLTTSGRLAGGSLVRSHRLWETFLAEEFRLPADHVHDSAERIEHFIGPGLQGELSQELRGPDSDPHGRAIPRGE